MIAALSFTHLGAQTFFIYLFFFVLQFIAPYINIPETHLLSWIHLFSFLSFSILFFSAYDKTIYPRISFLKARIRSFSII
jgi:hypothetical protein